MKYERHVVGQIYELKAAQHFSSKGYAIFWPLFTATKCDFIIVKDSETLKIQVKKATWEVRGNYNYLAGKVHRRKRGDREYTEDDFDFIVFIDDTDRMWMLPFTEVEGQSSVYLDSTNRNYTPTKDYTEYRVYPG